MKRDFSQEAAMLPVRSFDLLMHEYLERSFAPHFGQGVSALELGCFRGDFTRHLRKAYPDVTVVDAAPECLSAAKAVNADIECVLGTFEEVYLPQRYDAIFATHVLEHLDDPVKVLTRIHKEWLTDDGIAFLAVPNGHAMSRMIAWKMGLLNDPLDVLPQEAAHGHRRTYSMETFRQHIMASGMRIVEIGGVLYKSLSGWQMDRALEEGIIDRAYLDACFELGKSEPAHCASVYAIARPWR